MGIISDNDHNEGDDNDDEYEYVTHRDQAKPKKSIVYPNPVPTGSQLNIVSSKIENGEFTIYSSKGLLVNNGQFDSKEFSISTLNLSDGMYFIVLNNGEHTETISFIVSQ